MARTSSAKNAKTTKAKGRASKAVKERQRARPIDHVAAGLREYIRRETRKIYVQPDNPNSTRHLELHPSGFPYCGLRHAYKELKGIPREPLDFFGEYYTGLGTFAHELMQKYLGRGKQIMGDWECKECGFQRRFDTYKPCGKCRSPEMEYKELGITFGKYTHGHIDGVVKIDGKWYVIDYKTTSTKNNALHRTSPKYPYKHNVAQIESYCVYLEQLYDIEIAGWMLIYVSRDSSFRDFEVEGEIVDDKRKKELLKKLTRYDKHFGKVMKLKKQAKLKYFRLLVEEKPCATMKQYKAEMYGGYEMCPLAKDSVCFDRSKLMLVLKNITEGSKTVAEL